jgi:hypothetical protein
MGKGKFTIPDQSKNVQAVKEALSKYRVGQKDDTSFHDIRELTPIFAFDYISMQENPLCFNATSLTKEDYVGLLNGLRKISPISYKELSTTPIYRFHQVNFNETRVLLSARDFKLILFPSESLREKVLDEELPTLYQFDLHYVQEARAVGFLFKGIFYLIWYDRNHEVYKGR